MEQQTNQDSDLLADGKDDAAEKEESVQTTLTKEPVKETVEETEEPVSEAEEMKAVVVDIEDEDDEAYTKEFILKEAYPHFEANNQDAIWDLAHLKRYVKLSRGLLGTGNIIIRGMWTATGTPTAQGWPSMRRTAITLENGATERGAARAPGSASTLVKRINKTLWVPMSPTAIPASGRMICQMERARSTMR